MQHLDGIDNCSGRDSIRQGRHAHGSSLATKSLDPCGMHRIQATAGNSAASALIASRLKSDSIPDRRAPEVISFEPETVLSLPSGVSPAEFIQDQVNLIKESIAMFYDNYRDGLMGFQTSMEFSSEQEAESHYLTSILKAGAKASLENFIDGMGDECPELLALKVYQEMITAAFEEKERVEKAEGEVRVVEFIDELRNNVGKMKASNFDVINGRVREMQDTYARVDSAPEGRGGSELLDSLEKAQKLFRSRVGGKPAAAFQQEFTEEFAATGIEQVGPVTAGDFKNATLYMSCHVYRDSNGKYTVPSMDEKWELKTNAPKPDRVANSLYRALKAQKKAPFESELPKVVRATIEIESGHWYSLNSYDDTSYQFTEIDDVHFSDADAILHGNDPSEFLAAWELVLKSEVQSVKELTGSGA